MNQPDPQQVVKYIYEKTNLEFNSLGYAVDKAISSVTELLRKAINSKKAPTVEEIRKAAQQKVHITKTSNVLVFKCVLLSVFAIISNPLRPVFGLIAFPGTVLALHYYTDTVLQKNALGYKRQRMPQESAICAAAVGVLACILSGKKLWSGLFYGALVGILSCCYRALDYVYRYRK